LVDLEGEFVLTWLSLGLVNDLGVDLLVETTNVRCLLTWCSRLEFNRMLLVDGTQSLDLEILGVSIHPLSKDISVVADNIL
jgi:hypothetical protein